MTDAELWAAWRFWMLVAAVVIVVAAALLVTIWLTARSIAAHARRALAAAEAIRDNTRAIWELQTTNEVPKSCATPCAPSRPRPRRWSRRSRATPPRAADVGARDDRGQRRDHSADVDRLLVVYAVVLVVVAVLLTLILRAAREVRAGSRRSGRSGSRSRTTPFTSPCSTRRITSSTRSSCPPRASWPHGGAAGACRALPGCPACVLGTEARR
jgi:hypothetical protein